MTGFIPRYFRYFGAAGILAAGLALSGTTVAAQAGNTRTEQQTTEETAQARRVRDGLLKVLQQYPPAVGGVLKLDPSLLNSEQYLAGYPALVTYLNQHPEIRRSPSYYLEPVSTRDTGYGYYYDPGERAWNEMTEMAAISFVTIALVGGFIWLVRTAVDYRRWGRLAKVQAEAHTKLLDRFTGNDELLAYVQSPAGARFLQSSPISLDGSSKPVGAPIARILWSMQAGVVLAAAGIGLNYVSRRIDIERADPVFMFSVVLLAVGIGFVASAGLSYVLSRRLGLLDDPRAAASD
jgi:hypothetical protein